MTTEKSQSVLVTGTNSGFGLLTVKTLLSAGHRVFATMRSASGRNAAAAEGLRSWAAANGGELHILEMDVMDDASVENAVGEALTVAGHIDVAVNNAGVGLMGLLECATVEQARKVFETNVFGAMRVNRAVLPSMRARNSGLLIHISSSLGRLIIPYVGVYTASKFALEALAETYAYELKPLGIESILVQPGAYPTAFGQNVAMASDEGRQQAYGAAAAGLGKIGEAFEMMFGGPNPPQPQDVADAIAGLIAMPAGQRPLRTVVDRFTSQGVDLINQTSAQVQTSVLVSFGMAPKS